MKKIMLFILAVLMLCSCAKKTDSDYEDETKYLGIMDDMETVEFCPDDIIKTRYDIEYGAVAYIKYESKTTGCERGANILFPAGYDGKKKYPVLYLLHGMHGNEYSMLDPNFYVKELATNLAADGATREMIVVLPDIYASSDLNLKPGFTNETVAPYDNFINDLVDDLMPYVEKNFAVLTGRKFTAIAGYSMGGREALFIGISRPDLFGYICSITPAPGVTPARDWAMEHPGQLQEDELTFEGKEYTPYLFLLNGFAHDYTVGDAAQNYHAILEANGVQHVWYEMEGSEHDASGIRSGLYNFMSNIFPV